MTVTTFSTAGAATYTVPAGVRWISVELTGADGQAITADGAVGRGGRGAKMKVLVRVRPGEVLDVGVGRVGFSGNTDYCRGGVPSVALPGPPGGRAGGAGGGGSYIARRAFTGGADFEERLRANMIAVAGGGGGGRSTLAPFGWGAAGDYFGGSSNSFETLVARYITYGEARESEAWLASTFLSNPSVGAIKSSSMDRINSSSSSYGGLGGVHGAEKYPTYANSFNGGVGENGGAGGGGGYSGGQGGKVVAAGGSTWGSAGGAGLSWWDPGVSSVYYSSIGKYGTGSGSVVIDDAPSLAEVAPINITTAYYSQNNPSATPGDFGQARLSYRAAADGIPPMDTSFYYTIGTGQINGSGTADAPYVALDLRGATGATYSDGVTTSSAAGASLIGFGSFATVGRFNLSSSSGFGWLPGHGTIPFETRSGVLKGNVSLSSIFVRYSVEGEGKTWDTGNFSISYVAQHAPWLGLTSPASGAKVAIPASTGAATPFGFNTIDLASYGARPEYRDKVTEYEVNLYEADQTTRVGGSTVVPAPAIEYTESTRSLSVSPSLSPADWARVKFWDARVKDSKGTWSPAVPKRAIEMQARPVVSITAPAAGAVVAGSRPFISTSVDTPNGSGIFSTQYQILTNTLSLVHEKIFYGYVSTYTPDESVFAGVGSYVIRVTVTDLLGIASTAEIAVTSAYEAPPAVNYNVDVSVVDEAGYVEISWIGTTPEEGFARWEVYRREMPGTRWERLGTVPDAWTRVYRDYTSVASRIYMYSVTQTIVDRGGEVEGLPGVRSIDKTVSDITNLVTHPSPGYLAADIPVGEAGFTTKAGYSFGSATAETVVVETPPTGLPVTSYVGKSLKRTISGTVAPFGSGVSFSRHAFGPTGFTGPDANGDNGVPTGQFVNASVWVRSTVDLPEAALVLSYHDHASGGAAPGRVVHKVNIPANVWTRVSASAFLVSLAVNSQGVGQWVEDPRISLAWYDHAGGSPVEVLGAEVHLAGLMLVDEVPQSGTEIPFFNGARPSDGTFEYAWTGLPWVTKSVRRQITTFGEDRTSLIVNSHYWLVDPADPSSAMKLPNVKSYDFTDEYERNSTHVIGRGRHVDFGDRLGYNGSITLGLRGSSSRNITREDIMALVRRRTTFTLKTPFGESFSVALGNPSWTQLAGTGSADAGDLTLPFEEVY